MLSRKSLPVRKKGTCFSGTETGAPVRGLRPARALRCRTENAPKPRSSTRAPFSKVCVIVSSTTATTRSMSRRVKCGFSSWRISMSSDRSMRGCKSFERPLGKAYPRQTARKKATALFYEGRRPKFLSLQQNLRQTLRQSLEQIYSPFSAAPRMSPSDAPESEEPYCATASFSCVISSARMES